MIHLYMITTINFHLYTPLAITGWIAKYGIAGNWFWWGGVLGTMAMTVFFARKWRTSGVVTDVELSEELVADVIDLDWPDSEKLQLMKRVKPKYHDKRFHNHHLEKIQLLL